MIVLFASSTQTPEERPPERLDDRALSDTIPSADANQSASIEVKVELPIDPKTPHLHANQLHEPGSVARERTTSGRDTVDSAREIA